MKEREKNRFKIGDKVKVADLTKEVRTSFLFGVNPSMEEFFGTVVTVSEADHNSVRLKEDKGAFYWDINFIRLVEVLTQDELNHIEYCQGSEVTFRDLFIIDKVIAKKEDKVLIVLATDTFGKKHKIVNKCQEGDTYNVKRGIELACIKIAERILAKMKKTY